MTQEERSERSRATILDAALALFSHQGYRATSIREIAARAEVSTGSVYHHFKDKEELFDTLLQQFRGFVESPEFPLQTLIAQGAFPDRLHEIGEAVRQIVVDWRPNIALIYVDVIEFDGKHIRAFYANMAAVCERFVAEHGESLHLADRIRPNVPVASAMLLSFRLYFYYFIVEVLFGVPNQYGMATPEATRMIADIMRNGMALDRQHGADLTTRG